MTADSSWTPEDIVAQVDSARASDANPVARLVRQAASAAGSFGGSGGQSDTARAVVVGALIAAALAYLGRRLYRAVFTQHV
jgi:hypothetical protein